MHPEPTIARTKSNGPKDSSAKIGFEAKLWLAADKLRSNMDAAEYKHVVLGLIFLKYIGRGPHLAPGEPAAERDSFGEVVLVGRLREAIRRLNPAIPEEAREEALRKVLRVGTPSLTQTNRAFHRLLRDGIPVECVQNQPLPGTPPPGPQLVPNRSASPTNQR